MKPKSPVASLFVVSDTTSRALSAGVARVVGRDGAGESVLGLMGSLDRLVRDLNSAILRDTLRSSVA
jgi:hypothetical protein